MQKKNNPRALKHHFGKELLKKLAKSISKFYPSFDKNIFLKLAPSLEQAEMKARIKLISQQLAEQLPKNYVQALEIILKSVDEKFLYNFDYWPYTYYVEFYGHMHPDISMEALKKLTQVFTAEWAIRPFIKLYPEKTRDFLLQCAEDENPSIRRLASEGSRPRLPWGEQLEELIKNPGTNLAILEKLKDDPELYVRKSVANHLNDIAKDHPDLVISILKSWKKKSDNKRALHLDWVIKHAVRVLIKNRNLEALALLGVSKAQVEIVHFKIKKRLIRIGEKLEFEITLQSKSNKDQKIVMDYTVQFLKANQSWAAKVFKLKTLILPPTALIKIRKIHNFKKITTRKYYAGIHYLEIQINGNVLAKKDWALKNSL